MTPEIEIQIESAAAELPSRQQLRQWATTVLKSHCQLSAPILTLRLVDEPEGRQLNQQWRGKSTATNVLSFPLDVPPGVELDCLGDIVLCVPVIENEAQAQQKSMHAHWAHLVIHGVLHLLGYDHIDSEQAEAMEAIEIATLAQLGYPNPYT